MARFHCRDLETLFIVEHAEMFVLGGPCDLGGKWVGTKVVRDVFSTTGTGMMADIIRPRWWLVIGA
jgi:hypothetical protein